MRRLSSLPEKSMSVTKRSSVLSRRTLDVVHSGMVLLSDGKGHGKPARLVLTKELLTIQLQSSDADEPGAVGVNDTAIDGSVRTVAIEKGKEGLGLSIKGGAEVVGGQAVPVVVSKVIPGLPAAETGQVFVGDRILEVNGTPVHGMTHEEIVKMLREATTEKVSLTLQQETQMSPLFRRSASKRRSGSYADSNVESSNVLKGALKSPSVDRRAVFAPVAKDDDLCSNAWKTVARLPLPMAIITRYLWGTDKLRNNAFELRTVDGRRSGIIHCEDGKALEQWVKHCEHHIGALNRKSIKMSNKYLHPSEHITFIGWVEERMPPGYFEDPKLKWEQRFLILKGSDLCLFETPPLNSEELDRCICMYKIYETILRTAVKQRDRRPHVFIVDSFAGDSHYFSVPSVPQLQQIESAYYNSVYKAVTTVQTRTFACSFDGRPAGLVLDFKQGISLYDIPTKKYIWQYGFEDLITSGDDGKMRLELAFNDYSGGKEKKETKEIECDQVLAVVYTLHSFYITLIMGADPEFLKNCPLD
uniref:PDZ domain-containing protein n=1 Tax=Panagrellus redivivus TaxID=6233 RepID=A0A7E4V868_PANRE